MGQFRKITGLILAVAMTAALFSGCQQSYVATAPTTITVDGKEVEVSNVMKVNDHEVPLDLYRYFYLSVKYQMDKGDSGYWESNPGDVDSIKDEALKAVKGFFAVNEIAEENGVALTDTEKERVSSEVEDLVAQDFEGSKDKFNQALESSFMTEDLYNRIVENSLLQEKVSGELLNEKTGKFLITEEEMKEILQKDYLRASHILIKTGTEDDAAQKEKAEEALQKAQAGDDFDELVKEYGEDPGMKDNNDGFYFTEGMMVEPFYKGAVSLKEEEISGLVQSDFGYHIIKRLPMEEEYLEDNLGELTSQHRGLLLQREFEKIQDSMSVEYGEQYDLITVNSLK